jgi:WD40 repeat protein
MLAVGVSGGFAGEEETHYGGVLFWDLVRGTSFTAQVESSCLLSAICFSPDGRTLAASFDDLRTVLVEAATGTIRSSLEPIMIKDGGGKPLGSTLAFSADGRSLALGTRTPCRLVVWDVTTGKLKHKLVVKDDSGFLVSDLCFSINEKTLLVVGDCLTVKTFDLATGTSRSIETDPEAVAYAIAVSAHSATCATGEGAHIGKDFVKFLESPAVKRLSVAERMQKREEYLDKEGQVKLWDVATGKLLAILRGHAQPVKSLAFCAGARLLASADQSGTAKVWDLNTFKEVASYSTGRVSCLAFSHDGAMLATVDGGVQLWSVPKGRR